MSEAITPAALETLFTGARTHNGWLDIPVSDETLREIYDLMKWGRRPPTAPRRALCLCEARKEKRSCARRSPAATLRKRSLPRSRRLSPGTASFMSACLNCSHMAMPEAGLPPAPRWRKRPPSQQLNAGRVPDFRLPRARAGHRADVGF